MYTYKFERLPELSRVFDPSLIDKATNSAIGKTARKTRTFISKNVRQEYTVKAGDIRKSVGTRIRRPSRTSAALDYKGSTISLRRFGARKRQVNGRPGVSVAVKKGQRKVVKGGFSHGNGPIFKRIGRSRLPIEKLFGPSVPQMVSNLQITDKTNEFIGFEFPKEFDIAMRFFIGKQR